MNILHFHIGLNLACGISKTIFLIAKYPGEGCNHFVLALSGDAGDKFRDAGINTKILKGKNITGNLLFLNKYLKEKRIDVIHSHHRYTDYLSYLVSFKRNVKRVSSVQSFVFGKKFFSYKSPVLLAAGESVKKHLVKYFAVKEKRIKVFNNFIDLSERLNVRQRAEMLAEHGITDSTFIFGYAGRFSVKEKGIDLLFDSFKKLNSKYPGMKLLMVGSGEDIESLEIPENVLIVKAKKNIFDYYNIFDSTVLPSRVDPFPLTVLESGMMKVPFIGSDVNGIPEIAEDNKDGLLFEKENAGMLFEKMERMYLDREFAKQCAENLHNKVISKYNCVDALNKLNEIYGNL